MSSTKGRSRDRGVRFSAGRLVGRDGVWFSAHVVLLDRNGWDTDRVEAMRRTKKQAVADASAAAKTLGWTM